MTVQKITFFNRPVTVLVVTVQSGSTVDLSTRSSFEALPVYTENPEIYPVSGSETINSFMWNLFGLLFEYCKNFTRPLYVSVDSSIDIFSPGLRSI